MKTQAKTQITSQSKPQKHKTSFYIDNTLSKKMDALLPERKKTQFINDLIAKEVERLEKEKNKKEILKRLHALKPVKTNKPVVEMLRDLRENQTQRIVGKRYKTQK